MRDETYNGENTKKMSDETREEAIQKALSEDTYASVPEDEEIAVEEGQESLDEHDNDSTAETALDDVSSDSENEEDEPEEEDKGYYKNLFDDEWAQVLAAQQAVDEKKKKQEKQKKLQREREKRRRQEQERRDAEKKAQESRIHNESEYKPSEHTENVVSNEASTYEDSNRYDYPTLPPQTEAADTSAQHNYYQSATDSYEEYSQRQQEIRKKEIDKERIEATQRREQEYRNELSRKAEEINRRSQANLGATVKTSHLDLRDGADNLEHLYRDSGSVYGTNPTQSSLDAMGEKGEVRSGREYSYKLGGGVTATDYVGTSTDADQYKSRREVRILDSGLGYVDYTPSGTRVVQDIAGATGLRGPVSKVNSAINIRGSDFALPRGSAARVAENAKEVRRDLSKQRVYGSDYESGTLTNYRSQMARAESRESMRDRFESATGIRPKSNNSAVTRIDTAREAAIANKFQQYKIHYGNGTSLARKAAALPLSIAISVTAEAMRDSGGGKAVELVHDTVEYSKIVRYAALKNGNKLIASGTDGTFNGAKALRKFDKEQCDALKELTSERNILMANINKTLKVSGSVSPVLTSQTEIDRFLARTDISTDARKNLEKLKANFDKTARTGTWLDQNARSIDAVMNPYDLQNLGIRSVGQLSERDLKKLIRDFDRNSAEKLRQLANNLPNDIAEKLGVYDVKLFAKRVKDGTLERLLKEGKLQGINKELAEKILKNQSVRNMLNNRRKVMVGKRNVQLKKRGKRITGHVVVRKTAKVLGESEEAGLQAVASGIHNIQNVRETARLAKNIAKGSYKTGKATVKIVRKSAAKIEQVGQSIIDKQVDKMMLDSFRVKPKPKGPVSPRMLDNSAMLQKKGKKKALQAVQNAGIKITQAAKKVFAATKAAAKAAIEAVKAGAAAVKSIVAAIAGGGVALIIACFVVLVIVIIVLILSVFGADDEADIQKIVDKVNTERDDVVLDSIYDAFKGETDPNGKPYGYTTLDGQTSDNLLHGVTWEYADGISNNTAEIISLAAVYYQQNWPSSSDIVNLFSADDRAFFKFCRDLAGYGLDVTAQESHPYSCMHRGGCVLGYRDDGQTVKIKGYKLITTEHHCYVGNLDCGYYDADGNWCWARDSEHGDNHVIRETKVEDNGEHDVRVYFQNKLPDGANASDLTELPDEYTLISDGGEINSEDVHGNLVIDAFSCNLYKGNLNDWFVEPADGLSASFTVVTKLDDEHEERDTYTVTFGGEGDSFTAVPWCPGELSDNQNGHYDLNCTIYLTGYDGYTDPCLKPDAPESEDVPVDEDGIKGGTGTLVPLAHEINDGQLTRTVTKLNQWMQPYSGGTAARYTSTVTLPDPEDGFTCWYDTNGEDKDGNVAWAKLLYSQDWEELYGVTNGIKCRSFGSKFSDEEVTEFLDGMDFSNISDGRQRLVAAALANSGQFSYSLGSKPVGGPGHVGVKGAYDCSGYVRYLFWLCGYSFDAVNTADCPTAGDLQEISVSELQPGDMQVMLSADNGGQMGHIRIFLGVSGGKALWGECVGSRGSCVNTWTNSEAGMKNCRYYRYTGF